MGRFSAKMRVWNPASLERTEEIEAMVDTGAAFSWVHREPLERLGAQLLRRMGFRTIDGSIIERDTATVWVAQQRFSGPDTVVIAERTIWKSSAYTRLKGWASPPTRFRRSSFRP